MAAIALLIPTYNSAHTLPETLRSLLDQGESLKQVTALYLADDASTDATLDVARATWGLAEPPLVILAGEQNLVQWGNVNRALAHIGASGAEWVFILHADDLARPAWLEVMASRAASCPATVATVCASWDTLWPDGSVEPGEDDPTRPVEQVQGPQALRDTLAKGCWWHISGCAIRLRAFEQIGPFDRALPQSSDWEWLLRCLTAGWAVEYVPRALIGYRQHPQSVSAHSFRSDRDIRESLTILGRYRGHLTGRESLRLHARRAGYALRRAGRALVRRQPGQSLHALQTLALVARHAWASRATRPSDIPDQP